MTMRIHIKHATLADPVAIMIPEYAHLGALRDQCTSAVGIKGDFDLLLDNACRTKINSFDALRDEDVLILRSKRVREEEEEDDVWKRARLPETIVSDDDEEEVREVETPAEEEVCEVETPAEEDVREVETPAEEDVREVETPRTEVDTTTSVPPSEVWPSDLSVECTDFDRSFGAWKGKRLLLICCYSEPQDFPGNPVGYHDPMDVVFDQHVVRVDDNTIPMTGPSDDAFQFLRNENGGDFQVRELPPGIRLPIDPRRYMSEIWDVTGTGTHLLAFFENKSIYIFRVVSLHVTCISLTSRTDRRDAIFDNVIPHLPQLVFFDAITPSNADDTIVRRMRVMPKAKEGAREKKSACWNSHVSVLRGAIAANAFPHLIMEDDVTITASFDVAVDALPTDGVCFLAGKINAAKVKDFKEFERAGRPGAITSTMRRDCVNRLDKSVFRISSSAAYVVPTREVAQSLLEYLENKPHITHYDIDLCECPVTTSMWYPSPFESEKETARRSDIMTSQTQFFTTEYTRMA